MGGASHYPLCRDAVAPLVLFPTAAGAFFVAAYLPPRLPADGLFLSAFLAGAGKGVLTVPVGSNHPGAPELMR